MRISYLFLKFGYLLRGALLGVPYLPLQVDLPLCISTQLKGV